jgi:hypothetical protein
MWCPIELIDLYDEINRGEVAMDHPLRRLWNAIRVEPQKWKLNPWGDKGGGFWVVGVIGCHAIYFNDIEDGFNISRYDLAGLLIEYCCNQDGLDDAVQSVRLLIDDGFVSGRFGPPQPGVYPGHTGDT